MGLYIYLGSPTVDCLLFVTLIAGCCLYIILTNSSHIDWVGTAVIGTHRVQLVAATTVEVAIIRGKSLLAGVSLLELVVRVRGVRVSSLFFPTVGRIVPSGHMLPLRCRQEFQYG